MRRTADRRTEVRTGGKVENEENKIKDKKEKKRTSEVEKQEESLTVLGKGKHDLLADSLSSKQWTALPPAALMGLDSYIH